MVNFRKVNGENGPEGLDAKLWCKAQSSLPPGSRGKHDDYIVRKQPFLGSCLAEDGQQVKCMDVQRPGAGPVLWPGRSHCGEATAREGLRVCG